MMDDGDYAVDLEELKAVIADLEKCERALEGLTSDIERQMKVLQSTWEGLSAQAQAEAQEEWNQGLLEMRAALADMRQAARVASNNYDLAIKTNTSIWRGLA
jgi:WXG100 family type VII secretion target